MMTTKIKNLVLVLFFCAAFLLPLTAFPIMVNAATGGTSGGLTELKNNSEVQDFGITAGSGKESIVRLIGRIINYALFVAGAVAVLFVIYGGYLYLTSGGNEDSAKKGRTTVVNALIGLVIIILAYVIVNVVVNFISA